MYEFPQVDREALRKHKTEAVANIMKEADVDVIVMTGHDNIRYATDFGTFWLAEAFDWFAAVVTREGEASIFLPYVDKVISSPLPNSPWIKEYIPTPCWVSNITQEEFWVKALARKLEALKATKIGVESLPFQIFDGLKESLPHARFKSVYKALANVRQVKHPEEIKLLRASAAIASIAGSAGLRAMQAGVTDFEVLATIDQTMRSLGAEYITHNLCLSGETQVTAGWVPKGKRLWDSDTMFFDWGCYIPGGYASDACRVGFVGTPPKEVLRAYKALKEAYLAGQEVARPGVKVSQIDGAINDTLRKSGYPITPYSTGHGIGLRCGELPVIHRPEMMSIDAELKAGLVICLEPETMVESRGQSVVVKVEDEFLVTETGLERLTTTGYTPFWDD